MAKLPPTCDVIGCFNTRKRRQRLCDRCFARLPGDLRVGIAEAKHQHRTRAWNDMRRRAAEFLNLSAAAPAPPPRPAITPQRAFELQARLLGERA